MMCPHCGETLENATPSQRHYALVSKYADGTRSYAEIAEAINEDPEYKILRLFPRTRYSIVSSINNARKHGFVCRIKPHQVEAVKRRVRDSFVIWREWRGGVTQVDIAMRLGITPGRVNQIIRKEDLRQVKLGNVSSRGKLTKQLEEITT